MGTGKLIEGVWDCNGCGTVRILGRYRECPHCGKVRDSNVKFYMSDKKMYVPEEQAKTISRNPDWVCRFCDCLNPDTTDICKSCGASRTAENKNYFESRKEKDKEQAKRDERIVELTGTPETVKTESETSLFEETSSSEESYSRDDEHTDDSHTDDYHDVSSSITTNDTPIDIPERNHSWFNSAVEGVISFFEEYWPFILGGLAVILLILGGIWLFKPKVETVTVDNVYWERSIEVERYQTVDESDWYLPEGARLHETRSEIYTYKQVLDHYEHKSRQVSKQRLDHYETKVVGHRDLGNGYFEEITERVPVYETYYETEYYDDPVYRREPVYKTKYYYEIDKWLHEKNLITSGADKSPKWADTSKLTSDERTATKKEDYTITYTNKKGKQKTVSLPYSQWNDLMVGDEVTIKVTIFGDAEIV